MKIELTEKETEILCEYLDDLVDNDAFTDQKGMGDYNEKLDVLKSIREKMVLHNYYFTFGSDPKFPFYKGYLIVKAESINVACDKFEKKLSRTFAIYDQLFRILHRRTMEKYQT